MEKVFEVKDKTGRIIYLSKERLNHILKHPKINNSRRNKANNKKSGHYWILQGR